MTTTPSQPVTALLAVRALLNAATVGATAESLDRRLTALVTAEADDATRVEIARRNDAARLAAEELLVAYRDAGWATTSRRSREDAVFAYRQALEWREESSVAAVAMPQIRDYFADRYGLPIGTDGSITHRHDAEQLAHDAADTARLNRLDSAIERALEVVVDARVIAEDDRRLDTVADHIGGWLDDPDAARAAMVETLSAAGVPDQLVARSVFVAAYLLGDHDRAVDARKYAGVLIDRTESAKAMVDDRLIAYRNRIVSIGDHIEEGLDSVLDRLAPADRQRAQARLGEIRTDPHAMRERLWPATSSAHIWTPTWSPTPLACGGWTSAPPRPLPRRAV